MSASREEVSDVIFDLYSVYTSDPVSRVLSRFDFGPPSSLTYPVIGIALTSGAEVALDTGTIEIHSTVRAIATGLCMLALMVTCFREIVDTIKDILLAVTAS